jgi:tetratricopeptide (TPR) repeat protein
VVAFHSFLNEEDVVRQWSYNIPWNFYGREKITVFSEFLAFFKDLESDILPVSTKSWIMGCIDRPQTMLLPVARLHAKEAFHGDWPALPALQVIAQIQAIAEENDTLDILPDKLPLESIMKATHWMDLARNAVWHRKLAICLRNSGHINEAISYFERALEIDPNLVQARGGLATAYREQGYFNKVIDLELTNVEIISRRLENSSREVEDYVILRKELCISYEVVARTFWRLENISLAQKYWRKAAETQYIQDWAVSGYLALLAGITDATRWDKTRLLFGYLQSNVEADGQNRLIKYIHDHMWPETKPASCFVMIATAARETCSLPWLVGVYRSPIEAAAKRSHMRVLIFKLSLARLFIEYQFDFPKAEVLFSDIMEIASVSHPISLRDLEECKKAIAKDFCRICVRRMLESGNFEGENHQVRKVARLFRSGIEPFDVAEKIFWGERTHLYMALLQRLTGSIEAAAETLAPYMRECYALMHGTPDEQEIGQWMLGVSLIALGRNEDGLDLLCDIHTASGWKCNGCQVVTDGSCIAELCEYCFEYFCQDCVDEIQQPRLTRFCLPGHRGLLIKPSVVDRSEAHIWFRAKAVTIKECLRQIAKDWNLHEV